MRWAHNIDLGEFAENLKGNNATFYILNYHIFIVFTFVSFCIISYYYLLIDSGVHGGLVVLEPSFTGETMATALGIPPSKSIIRRHLVAEFDALIIPARYVPTCLPTFLL